MTTTDNDNYYLSKIEKYGIKLDGSQSVNEIISIFKSRRGNKVFKLKPYDKCSINNFFNTLINVVENNEKQTDKTVILLNNLKAKLQTIVNSNNNTINTHNSYIKTMTNANIVFDGSMSFDDIFEIILQLKTTTDEKYSDNSILCFLKALKWKFIFEGISISEETDNKIKEKINEYNGKYNNKEYVLTDNQRDQFVNWNTIQKVYEQVKLLKNNNKTSYMQYVILSLYACNNDTIRRLSDYSLMHIIKEYNDQLPLDKNYYVLVDKPFFVFNVYKTSKTYDTKIIQVNDELCNILNEYITKYGITESLLNKTEGALKEIIRNIFNRYCGKSVSVDILRHAYISHHIQSLKSPQERQQMATKFGHSLKMQEFYITKLDIGDIEVKTNDVVTKRVRKCKYDNEEDKKQAKIMAKKLYREKQKMKNK